MTLNPSKPILEHAIYDEVQFQHPVFDKPALKAQQDVRRMQGNNHTWFAGAWNRHGFHEDGIASAMRIVRELTNRQQFKGMDNAFHKQCPEGEFSVDMRASA